MLLLHIEISEDPLLKRACIKTTKTTRWSPSSNDSRLMLEERNSASIQSATYTDSSTGNCLTIQECPGVNQSKQNQSSSLIDVSATDVQISTLSPPSSSCPLSLVQPEICNVNELQEPPALSTIGTQTSSIPEILKDVKVPDDFEDDSFLQLQTSSLPEKHEQKPEDNALKPCLPALPSSSSIPLNTHRESFESTNFTAENLTIALDTHLVITKAFSSSCDGKKETLAACSCGAAVVVNEVAAGRIETRAGPVSEPKEGHNIDSESGPFPVSLAGKRGKEEEGEVVLELRQRVAELEERALSAESTIVWQSVMLKVLQMDGQKH